MHMYTWSVVRLQLVLMPPVDCNSIDVSSVALSKTCKTDTVTHAGDGGSSL